MIFEHEIPSRSRLYFGDGARIKRGIETSAAEMLEAKGYQEIVTPLFSYHQHESFDDSKALIRLNDAYNHEVSLRADSTADVVRIVTKRLGRSSSAKRWFYIQPVFTFPTAEQYQIGAESLGGTVEEMAQLSIDLLKKQNIRPLFQLANIAIPRILNEKYGIELEHLKQMKVEKILESEHPWIKALLAVHGPEDLEDLSQFPKDISEELDKISKVAQELDCDNVLVSPLYYAKMRYYDSLVFRAFEDNRLYLTGGIYHIKGVSGAGFALYTDAVVAKLMQKGR